MIKQLFVGELRGVVVLVVQLDRAAAMRIRGPLEIRRYSRERCSCLCSIRTRT